jgi:hypothetical protein
LAQRLAALFEADRGASVRKGAARGLPGVHAVLTSPRRRFELSSRSGSSFPAASAAIDLLVTLGSQRELTGKRHDGSSSTTNTGDAERAARPGPGASLARTCGPSSAAKPQPSPQISGLVSARALEMTTGRRAGSAPCARST